MRLYLPRPAFQARDVCRGALAALALFLVLASGASAQIFEQHGSARISFALVDMRATALPSSSGEASVELDHVLGGVMSSRAYDGAGGAVEASRNWQDGEPYPWRITASFGRGTASADASDGLYTRANLSAEATRGDNDPWVAANADAYTSALLMLSPQTELSITVHITADSEGYVEWEGGTYTYQLALGSEDGTQGVTVRKDSAHGQYDEFVTLSLTNFGSEPMGMRWFTYANVFASPVPVPEPPAMAMLALGILVLGAIGRRRGA
jgi:hypothetical protein